MHVNGRELVEGLVMLKSNYYTGAALIALLASTSIPPVLAQESPVTEEALSTEGTVASASGMEQINQALEALTAELMQSLSPTGTYAVKSANDTTSGVPEDLLTQMTSSLQSSLMLASDFQITLIDQAQLQAAWSNAVEFNGADFEKLVENANFDALIVLHTRATPKGIDMSLQAIGATGENSGLVIASSKTASIGIDWNSMAGVDVGGIDQKIEELDAKISEAVPIETKSEPKARVEYKKYVDGTECIKEVSEPHGCFDTYYDENDRIVAIVDGQKFIADPGIDGSKYVVDLGMDREWKFDTKIVWQGDFDNDGYNDAVLGSDCGGSGCPPIYRIVLYKGEGKFSILPFKFLENWEEDNPKIRPEGFHYVLTLSGLDGTQDSTLRYNRAEVEYRVENGTLVEKPVGDISNQFNIKEFKVDDAVTANSLNSCNNNPDAACVSWDFDLSGDGIPETLSCGYWERWVVLTNCEIKDPSKNRIYHTNVKLGDGSVYDAQCKTIAVTPDNSSI